MISAPPDRKHHLTFASMVISVALHVLLILGLVNPSPPKRIAHPPMQITLTDSYQSIAPLTAEPRSTERVESTASSDAATTSPSIHSTGANESVLESISQAESVVVGSRPRGWGGREYIVVEQRGERTLMEVMPLLQSTLQQTASIDCDLQISANSYVARLRCENPSDQQLLLSMLSGRFSFQDQITHAYACVQLKNGSINVEKKCTTP